MNSLSQVNKYEDSVKKISSFQTVY